MNRRCEEIRPLLVLLAAQELPAGEGPSVADHLAECDACRREWEALRQGFDMIAALRPVAPPSEVSARLRSRVRWEREGRRLVRALRPLAAAAVVLIAVVAWVAAHRGASPIAPTAPDWRAPLAAQPHWRNGVERGLADVWMDVRDLESGKVILSPAVPPEGLATRSSWPAMNDDDPRALRWEWGRDEKGGFDLRTNDLQKSIDDLSRDTKGS